MQVIADGLLRDAVGRLGSLRMAFPHGQHFGRAVERAAGRREHDLLHSRGQRAFADVQGADDVDHRVLRRLRDRHPHVDLRREVEHDVGPPVHDELGDRR